jgi:hypothetical protein
VVLLKGLAEDMGDPIQDGVGKVWPHGPKRCTCHAHVLVPRRLIFFCCFASSTCFGLRQFSRTLPCKSHLATAASTFHTASPCFMLRIPFNPCQVGDALTHVGGHVGGALKSFFVGDSDEDGSRSMDRGAAAAEAQRRSQARTPQLGAAAAGGGGGSRPGSRPASAGGGGAAPAGGRFAGSAGMGAPGRAPEAGSGGNGAGPLSPVREEGTSGGGGGSLRAGGGAVGEHRARGVAPLPPLDLGAGEAGAGAVVVVASRGIGMGVGMHGPAQGGAQGRPFQGMGSIKDILGSLKVTQVRAHPLTPSPHLPPPRIL